MDGGKVEDDAFAKWMSDRFLPGRILLVEPTAVRTLHPRPPVPTATLVSSRYLREGFPKAIWPGTFVLSLEPAYPPRPMIGVLELPPVDAALSHWRAASLLDL